jgi:hypothetical protein
MDDHKNDEWGRIVEESSLASFNTLSCYFPGGTEENQPRYPASRPRTEPLLDTPLPSEYEEQHCEFLW